LPPGPVEKAVQVGEVIVPKFERPPEPYPVSLRVPRGASPSPSPLTRGPSPPRIVDVRSVWRPPMRRPPGLGSPIRSGSPVLAPQRW
jgi:hypothetical protein